MSDISNKVFNLFNINTRRYSKPFVEIEDCLDKTVLNKNHLLFINQWSVVGVEISDQIRDSIVSVIDSLNCL